MFFDVTNTVINIFYLIIIVFSGFVILYLRRKAEGSKSLYKLLLIFYGIIISKIVFIKMNLFFINQLSFILFIILLFELSMRLTNENINNKSTKIFFSMLILNLFIVGFLAFLLITESIVHILIFAILLCAVEYFMIDELKKEGDISSPLIIFIVFTALYYNELNNFTGLEKIYSILQYLLIGLGMGIIFSIITFKILKPKKIDWMQEIMLAFTAYLAYIITELANGSGILAVIIFGVFFGNSNIRKKSEIKTLSPFLFKSTEVLIFILLGIISSQYIDYVLYNKEIIYNALFILAAYYIIRFLITSIFYKKYSIHNKLLITLAPKGIMYATAIIVLSKKLSNSITASMILILIISLIITWITEIFENKRIKKMDLFFETVKNIRYGKKRKH
ncbi:MAG: cation:proton antiporter [Candidatus Woesearchaeota archaeon]